VKRGVIRGSIKKGSIRMVMSGWFNFTVNFVLFITLALVIFYYYRPKKKQEDIEKDEQPKYRMLDDEDEKPK
jgi:hypothetical protein